MSARSNVRKGGTAREQWQEKCGAVKIFTFKQEGVTKVVQLVTELRHGCPAFLPSELTTALPQRVSTAVRGSGPRHTEQNVVEFLANCFAV